MDDAIETTEVETEAGTYTISEYYDDDGGMGNPLTEYDQEGFGFAISDRGSYLLNTLTGAAGNAVQTWLEGGYDFDQIERRFALWQRITGDRTVLVTYQADVDRSTWYRCLILVDYDHQNPAWDRKASALATIKEYESWAAGDVYGYVVEDPSGEHVDSCWGFIGDSSREYMRDQARDSITWHAKERLDKAQLVGAGFVGII